MVNLQFYRIKMKCTWSMYENKSENELNNISGINYIQLPIKKKKKDFFKFFFLQFLLYTDQEKYVMNYWPKVLINLAVPQLLTQCLRSNFRATISIVYTMLRRC